MAQLTHEQYEVLERAVVDGRRIAFRRRGRREWVVIPLTLRLVDGREVVDARNPKTGRDLVIYLDQVDAIEALS